MKFTESWLREHLDTEADLATICAKLTAIGLEVEEVHNPAAGLENFVVARVLTVEKHPNADKLRVCTVDPGTGPIQVVCGAPNARAGMVGVFARDGLTIPGTGLVLKPSTIRGVASNGMLVSEREMGLSDEHDGIIDLPESAAAHVGRPFAEVMGLSDPVVTIKLTPNRPDCTGIRGIARDLAAAHLGALKPLKIEPVAGTFPSSIAVSIDDYSACPLFIGREIRAVKNGPSPKWLQDRLKSIGLRPISALVDITNWFTHALGRPLHVFDADKVKGALHVRLGRPGDELLALDGKTYQLGPEMCVIADESGAESIGGIMGGEHSGCTDATTRVFVEAALFDPIRTAATGRKLGIISDARYRFERGVDPEFVRPAVELATRMILDLCGGEASEPVVAGVAPEWRRQYSFRPERVAALGGVPVTAAEAEAALEAVGCVVAAGGGVFTVTPPSWRPDIHGEADLVEEVLRLKGFDAIPSVPLPQDRTVPAPGVTPMQRRVRIVRRALAARGLNEAVTYSFVPTAHALLFGGGRPELAVANPISAELDAMRPSILPALLAASKRNADRSMPDHGLFEVGPQYRDDTATGQDMVAAGIRAGQSGPRHWSVRPRGVDAYDAKADALAALAAAGAPAEQLLVMDGAPDWYHPGRSATLRLGPKTVLAHVGELHPRVLQAFDLRGPVVAFELFIERVPFPKNRTGRSKGPLALNDLPAVERDFAFVVDDKVQAFEIVKAARGAEKALITQVSVFDQFIGPSIGEGRKSVAISVRLEPKEKTLTDPEIEAVAAKVIAAVAKATGATLRG